MEKEGIRAAAQSVGPFTDLVEKRISARCVEKQPAARPGDAIGVQEGFFGKVDMLKNIPEGNDIEKTGKTLLPVPIVDGLPVQRDGEFLLRELPENFLRLYAMDQSPRFGQKTRKQSDASADVEAACPLQGAVFFDEAQVFPELFFVRSEPTFDVVR